MPTVLRFGGFRVVIYPNDHRPAHVHVIGRGSEAVFNLHCGGGPIELRENHGFQRKEIREIRQNLQQRKSELCSRWEEIHGNAR